VAVGAIPTDTAQAAPPPKKSVSKIPLQPGQKRLIIATCEKGAVEDVADMRRLRFPLALARTLARAAGLVPRQPLARVLRQQQTQEGPDWGWSRRDPLQRRFRSRRELGQPRRHRLRARVRRSSLPRQ